MEDLKPTLNNQQYSTVNKTSNNSTVDLYAVLTNLSDIIPNDGYAPFYAKRLKELGYDKFIELANKARAGSDTPQRLFCWMLKNPDLVK